MLDLSQTNPDYKIVFNGKEELSLFLIPGAENSFRGICIDPIGIKRFFNGKKEALILYFHVYEEIPFSSGIESVAYYQFPLQAGVESLEGRGEVFYSTHSAVCKMEKHVLN